MTELARFGGHGHPALRASHGKTLEFTAESAVTARATCVLAVSSALPAAPVAGPIRIVLTVTVDGRSDSISLDATGNSAWQPGSSAVLRRSAARLPDTFATDASLAAADLPRPFAAALADGSARVEAVVSSRPAEAWLVRFRLDTSADSPFVERRLRAEAVAADTVLAEDAGARAWLRELGIAVAAPSERRGRVLSVSSGPAASGPGASGPGASGPAASGPVSSWPAASGPVGFERVDEVIGWPVELAALAASGDAGPAVLAVAAGPAEVARLAATNPQAAVVFRSEVSELGRLLARAGRPSARLVLVARDDPERPYLGTVAEPESPARGEVIGYLGGRPGPASDTPVDPVEFVRGLLAHGATARTVTLALTGLPGWSRRAAYDFVLSVQNSG